MYPTSHILIASPESAHRATACRRPRPPRSLAACRGRILRHIRPVADRAAAPRSVAAVGRGGGSGGDISTRDAGGGPDPAPRMRCGRRACGRGPAYCVRGGEGGAIELGSCGFKYTAWPPSLAVRKIEGPLRLPTCSRPCRRTYSRAVRAP